jgi:MFS transporter, DHA1 family, tetracycline resistance protein
MLRSPLLPIFLTVLVDVLGLTLMLPLLPFYAEHFGASPLVATILGASYAACQLVSGPILGRLSDRIGRKPVLLVSQMGTLCGFLLIGGATSLPMLFLGRIVDGLTAGNLSIAQAYISDVTKPENRTKAFGLIGIAFGSGFLVGPAISGIMAKHYGFSAPAYAAAGLSLLSIVLTTTLLPGKARLEALKAQHGEAPSSVHGAAPPAGERTLAFGRFLSRPLPRRRLLQFFCFTTSFATLTGGLALFLERQSFTSGLHFDVQSTGYVFMASGLVGGAIQGGVIGRLVKRLGEARLALVGFLTMAAAYPLLGAAHTVPFLLALVMLASFGVAVVRPCITTLITKSVGRGEQGAALGTSQSLASISQIVGQPLAGILIENHLNPYYGVAAGVLALALAGCDRPTEPPVPAPTKRAVAASASATASASAAIVAPTRIPAPARIVAIGDLHGDLDATRAALRLGGAIDEKDHWSGGSLMVVQTGDQLDRGDGERAILDLLERLEAEAKAAGGALLVLNGNHEVMNVQGDFRYATDGGLEDFATVPGLDMTDLRLLKVPDPAKARAAAFLPGGPYAKKLAKRGIVAVVGDTVFLHGGLLPKHVQYGIDRMNREVSAWMEGTSRDLPALVTNEDGPIWLRRYSAASDADDCRVLKETLALIPAKRMVVGHTVQRNGINAACGEAVWRIDVGLSKVYGGKPQVLEIAGDAVRAIGPK